MPDFPYPTLVEVIRACAKMFAVKSGNKELDDKALDKAIDPRRLDELKADIFENLGRPLSSSSLATLKSCFESFENDYIQIVATQFADGVTRSSMRELKEEDAFSLSPYSIPRFCGDIQISLQIMIHLMTH